MKIYTNQIDPIVLQESKVNVASFESSEMQREFRELLLFFSTGKKKEHPYLIFEQEKELTNRTMNILFLNGGDLNYLESKDYVKLIQNMLFEQFKTIPALTEKWMHFEKTCQIQLESLSHHFSDFYIDLEFKDIVIDQIWKMLELHIVNDETETMTILDFRKLQIESWKKIINQDLPTVIIYQFPEADVTIQEMNQLMTLLNDIGLTILCISNSYQLIENTSKDSLFLIKERGSLYNVEQLERELESFEFNTTSITNERLASALAFHDFTNQTMLLDSRWKKFLDSSKY
ncbi:hypothetical protein [Kurthia gibsonii]|uniref:hypothetical protein n=1 Tax=Kurthia gibsonii TaxID=33946 RepID=UPI00301AEBA5